jgi:hypothetical protein
VPLCLGFLCFFSPFAFFLSAFASQRPWYHQGNYSLERIFVEIFQKLITMTRFNHNGCGGSLNMNFDVRVIYYC